MKKLYFIPTICNFIFGLIICFFVFTFKVFTGNLYSFQGKSPWIKDAVGLLFGYYFLIIFWASVYLLVNLFFYKFIKKRSQDNWLKYIKTVSVPTLIPIVLLIVINIAEFFIWGMVI